MMLRCSPGFVCGDIPPNLPDAPGICLPADAGGEPIDGADCLPRRPDGQDCSEEEVLRQCLDRRIDPLLCRGALPDLIEQCNALLCEEEEREDDGAPEVPDRAR